MAPLAKTACVLFPLALACRRAPPPAEPSAFQKRLQERLIKAGDGERIELPEGRFALTRTLTLSGKKRITLAGAGMDRSVLSFAGQTSGAEGIKVASLESFTIEDLTIQDTKGDALKVERSRGVAIRNVKAEWTRGPHRDNGGYATACTRSSARTC